ASQAHLEDAASRYPTDVKLLAGYGDLLLAHGEFREVDRIIRRLRGIDGARSQVAELKILSAAARDDQAEVRQLLQALTPRNRTSENSLKILPNVINLAEKAGDYQFAIALAKEYVANVPKSKLSLARLEAFYGDPDKGLEMLRSLFNNEDYNPDNVLDLVVKMYRRRRPDVGDALDVKVNELIRIALRRDRESARRLISRAEVRETQGQHNDAIAAYEELLAREDVPRLIRATALNNLAYLIALANKSDKFDVALAAANESVDLMGPLSDVLDTRAVVYLARGDFEQALHDMELAILVDRTASKYYHLAKAQLGVGRTEDALQSWQEAVNLGVGPDSISPLEQGGLRDFAEKIKAIETSSGQL
ncbi:MAG: hypothetical protein AAF961_13600, partial [Planctomycetota bacterium]